MEHIIGPSSVKQLKTTLAASVGKLPPAQLNTSAATHVIYVSRPGQANLRQYFMPTINICRWQQNGEKMCRKV